MKYNSFIIPLFLAQLALKERALMASHCLLPSSRVCVCVWIMKITRKIIKMSHHLYPKLTRQNSSFISVTYTVTHTHTHAHVHAAVFDGTPGWLDESAGCAGRPCREWEREQISSYLKQLIRQTHIAGQLFKAFSWISYRRKLLEASPSPSVSHGREGHGSLKAEELCRLKTCCVSRSKSLQSHLQTLPWDVFYLFRVAALTCKLKSHPIIYPFNMFNMTSIWWSTNWSWFRVPALFLCSN